MTNLDPEALEELLRHASPRQAPSPQEMQAVKAAVRDEWSSVARRHQVQRRVLSYAIAATAVLGVFAAFNAFRTPTAVFVQVASIEKSFGPVYLLGEQAELRETGDLDNILSGQTIVTGNDAGLAVAWGNGGSVRIDQNTRVEFMNDESIYLESGRVYFDSAGSSLVAGDAATDSSGLVLLTDYGEVRHQGTQFMTKVASELLVVSVREGRVSIDGTYHEHTAAPGEQVTLAGRQRPSVLSIDHAGGPWSWISRTTPAADVDGKSLHEFLVWVSRELGLELRFEGGAELVAQDAILRGTIDSQPGDALRMRLASAALAWRIDEGVIYVSDDR